MYDSKALFKTLWIDVLLSVQSSCLLQWLSLKRCTPQFVNLSNSEWILDWGISECQLFVFFWDCWGKIVKGVGLVVMKSTFKCQQPPYFNPRKMPHSFPKCSFWLYWLWESLPFGEKKEHLLSLSPLPPFGFCKDYLIIWCGLSKDQKKSSLLQSRGVIIIKYQENHNERCYWHFEFMVLQSNRWQIAILVSGND